MEEILETRIKPARLQSSIVKRKKLIDRINENQLKSLILISAPAGYGKTTLIQDYLERSIKPYLWLHVHSDMNDFYTFLTYIVHSLKSGNSKFGAITLALIDDYRKKMVIETSLKKIVTDITTTFTNEFYKHFTDDVLFVIDDLGNIENSEWLNLTFQTIFENMPQNLHIIITSRQVPNINLAVLQAKRNLYKIDQNDLTFTSEEIGELLGDVYKINYNADDINLLNSKASGWITGMHLILQNYGEDFRNINLDKLIIAEDIFNYFTEDIFNSLENNVREFLLDTALLERFSVSLCEELLKIKDSRKIISELTSKNIFIKAEPVTSSDSEQFYSYQLLFRTFLESKLNELRSREEIKKLQNIMSEHFNGTGEFDKAIIYSLSGGNTARAIELIKQYFQAYFDSGRFELIWKWLNGLREDVIEKDPYLLYYKSLMLKFYKSSYGEAARYLNKAVELSKVNRDQDLMVKCYYNIYRNMIVTGNTSGIIESIDRILSNKLTSLNKAKLNYLLAYCYFQNSEYDKSLKYLDETSKYIEDSGAENIEINVDIYNLYGHIYLIRGDYSKSVVYYEKVAKESSQLVERFEAYCNIILLFSQSGKFEKAEKYIAWAKEIKDSISIPIFNIIYLLSRHSFSFEMCDYAESITILEEVNLIAAKLNHKGYIYLSYSLIGDTYYYLDKPAIAEGYYDQAFKYINEDNIQEKMWYAVTKALLLKKTTMPESAGAVLLDAYEYYSKNKFDYNKAQTALHLADFYLRTGASISAVKFLTEALTMAESKEYNSFIQREILSIRYLFDFAAANNIKKDYIKFSINELQSQVYNKWITPEGRDSLKKSMEYFYDVRLNTFGKLEISVRDKAVEEKQWQKRKFKLIFIFLILSARKEVSKDKIIDLFFTDTPPESIDNLFHQAVSRIRNLVKIINPGLQAEKEKGKKGMKIDLIPPVVLYEEKLLKINPDSIVYIDCSEFENIYKAGGSIKDKESKSAELKKAISLYKGEFLEGNYETWIEELRTRYKTYFISLSEELIKLFFENQNYSETLNYSENLLKHDPLNLEAAEYILKAYEKMNKLSLARTKYEKLKRDYEKEYGENLPDSFNNKVRFAYK